MARTTRKNDDSYFNEIDKWASGLCDVTQSMQAGQHDAERGSDRAIWRPSNDDKRNEILQRSYDSGYDSVQAATTDHISNITDSNFHSHTKSSPLGEITSGKKLFFATLLILLILFVIIPTTMGKLLGIIFFLWILSRASSK